MIHCRLKILIWNILGNGSLTSAHKCDSLEASAILKHISELRCSSTTDSICFSIAESATQQACRINFASLDNFTYSGPSSNSIIINSVNPLNDEQVIVGAFENSSDHNHNFYKYNFTDESVSWAVHSTTLGKYLLVDQRHYLKTWLHSIHYVASLA